MILQAVPTNIITGFLGTGKTSLIKRLLAEKPEGQVWAVLVNEFGQIGLDASLLNQSGKENIQIKEVAGGCICCAAGVPLQVAVNQLLMKAKPDRLIIEPTGLGHPKAIIDMLSEPHFKQSLKLNTCVSLVDARKLDDDRYIHHDSFIQQLQSCDLILAAKSDAYRENELTKLTAYLATLGLEQVPMLAYSNDLAFPESLIQGLSKPREMSADHAKSSRSNAVQFQPQSTHEPATSLLRPNAAEPLLSIEDGEMLQDYEYDEQGIYRQSNTGEGYFSYGWVFDIHYEFNLQQLVQFTKSIEASRVKLVMITNEGVVGINISDGEFNAMELDDAMDSRIEIISIQEMDCAELEQKLLKLA